MSDDHTLIVVMRTDAVEGQEYAYVSNLQWFEFGPDPAPEGDIDLTPLNDAIAAVNAALGGPEDPGLNVTVEAATRTVAGKQYVSVRVTNDAAVAVDVVVDSVYGSKTFAGVQPGDTASVSVNSRLTSIPAGDVTVTVTGGDATVTRTAAYEAAG